MAPLFFLGAAVVAVVFLAVTPFARSQTVQGVLMPVSGAIEISSIRPGVVSQVHVTEGQVVAQGTPILTLAVDNAVEGGRPYGDLLVEAAGARESALEDQVLAQRTVIRRRLGDLDVRRAALQSEIAALGESRVLAESQVAMTTKVAESGRPLREKGFVSVIQLNQWEQAVIQAKSQLITLDQRLSQARAQQRRLDIEQLQMEAEGALEEGRVAGSRADLMEKRATILGQRDLVLVADRAGKIATLQARRGATVTSGTVLATLLPVAEGLQVELWVPSRAMAFVRSGQPVRLMYDSFPFQKFGTAFGSVSRVSAVPVAPDELPVALESKEALYPVYVSLDQQSMLHQGKQWPLMPGMRLNADIILENRSLLAWIFEPLLAARARTPVPRKSGL